MYGKTLVEVFPQKVRAMWESLRPISPVVFARKALDSVARNKAIIIVPAWWKLFWWIDRSFPSAGIYLAQRDFRKVQRQLGIA